MPMNGRPDPDPGSHPSWAVDRLSVRMFPPASGPYQTMVANGRQYTGSAGVPQTVPDFDAGILEGNGWTVIAPSGPTGSRPPANVSIGRYRAVRGFKYWDETLAALIEFDGATWRDPASGAAV